MGVPGAFGIGGSNPVISAHHASYRAELSKSRAAAGGGGRIWESADFKARYLARMADGVGDEKIAPEGQFGAGNGAQVKHIALSREILNDSARFWKLLKKISRF